MFQELDLAVFAEDFDTSEAFVPLETLWEFIHHVTFLLECFFG